MAKRSNSTLDLYMQGLEAQRQTAEEFRAAIEEERCDPPQHEALGFQG